MVEQLNKFVMTIVGIAFILAIGLIVIGSLKDSIGDDITATSTNNENITWVNNTYVALAVNGFEMSCGTVTNTSISVTEATLTSTGPAGGAGNYTYTCDINGLKVTVYDAAFLSDYVSINYSTKIGNEQYNATATNATKLATIPTWIGILITVVLAFIVLGYFYSRNN